MGPTETPYEGGFFQAEMRFPNDYPNHPPTLRFISEFWHPNVYDDGRVCISILHARAKTPSAMSRRASAGCRCTRWSRS